MENVVRAHVLVAGHVQGVAYRAFTLDEATRQGLTGWVRNLSDGRVEINIEGDRTRVEQILSILQEGPPLAFVKHLDVTWLEGTPEWQDFRILR